MSSFIRPTGAGEITPHLQKNGVYFKDIENIFGNLKLAYYE